MRDDVDSWDLEELGAEGGRPLLTGEPALDRLLEALMDVLLETRDPDGFFAAVRAMAASRPEAEEGWRVGLQAIARTLWNVTPLPWAGFRRHPLPKPERNAPCPCGSGRKFKQCCRSVSLDVGFISPQLAEMLLARRLRETDFRAAEAQGGPLLQLALGQRALEEGHPGRAKRILSGLLEEPLKNESIAADAVDALGVAYIELGQTQAGITAMRRLAETRAGSPASAAYRVLSAMAFENRDFEDALRLARLALDAAADNPMAGMVEIQALLMLDRFDEVDERLAHWQAMARRHEDPLLARMFEDLAEEVAEIEGQLQALVADDLDEPWHEAVEAALREPLQPVSVQPGPEMEEGRASMVLTLAPEVEAAQQALFEGEPDVLAWLQAYPLGLQSPSGLEQVIQEVPLDGPVDALFEHRLRLVEHWLEQVPEGALLPWGWVEQRGILRTLYNIGLDAEANGDVEQAIAAFERVLALEPDDHVGARFPLVNLLLRERRDDEALAWIERYPSLFMPQMAFGKVLALVRLGQVNAAEAAFRAAHAQLPEVLPYLKATRMEAPPDLSPGMVRIGGEDQAWHYREEMRPTFVAERGLLSFLDGIAKRMAQGR